MVKEHRQADGHPPKVGAGARLNRVSTRGSARARGPANESPPSATAMLKRGSSQDQQRGLAAAVGVSVSMVHLMKSK